MESSSGDAAVCPFFLEGRTARQLIEVFYPRTICWHSASAIGVGVVISGSIVSLTRQASVVYSGNTRKNAKTQHKRVHVFGCHFHNK